MSEKLRILLVDDDRDVARAASIRLQAAGYDVLVAHDGKEGLATAVEEHPDAIVLDLRMPVMDGHTVLRKLHERRDTDSIPVVVLSASMIEQSKARALDYGARYFLEKPYEPRRLLEVVQAAVAPQVSPPPARKGAEG